MTNRFLAAIYKIRLTVGRAIDWTDFSCDVTETLSSRFHVMETLVEEMVGAIGR